MKTLIFSDVHGNLPALETMLEKEGSCDKYICLGDLVNYGPWSNECVDLAISLPNSTLIRGNHEEAFINGFYPGSNSLVQAFFQMIFPHFKRKEIIQSFLLESKFDKFLCKHTINDSYIYPDTSIQLDNNYIVGHSHHQFEYKNNNFTIYNTGSVGQNREFINVINYLVYDDSTKLMQLKQLTYNVDLMINEMRVKKFPKECMNYYLKKKRYNG